MSVITRVNISLGDTGRAHDRVVRMTNVHFDANPHQIRKFFGKYTVLDQFRTVNPKNSTLSVVYVLFGSELDKNAVLALDKRRIRDRSVNLMPAPTGNYKIKGDNSGFVKERLTSSRAAGAASSSIVASPSFNDDEFPPLGTLPTKKGSTFAIASSPIKVGDGRLTEPTSAGSGDAGRLGAPEMGLEAAMPSQAIPVVARDEAVISYLVMEPSRASPGESAGQDVPVDMGYRNETSIEQSLRLPSWLELTPGGVGGDGGLPTRNISFVLEPEYRWPQYWDLTGTGKLPLFTPEKWIYGEARRLRDEVEGRQTVADRINFEAGFIDDVE